MNYEKYIENNVKFDEVRVTDTFNTVIEKFNKNFERLQFFTNYVSKQGPSGVPGSRGIPGPADRSFSRLIRSSNAKLSNDFFSAEQENIFFNAKTNLSFLLTDITGRSFRDLRLTKTGIPAESASYISNIIHHKLKIISSDEETGLGRHIHLQNSSFALQRREFLKNSGFLIDSNKTSDLKETLLVKFNKSEVSGHKGEITFQSDMVSFSSNDEKNTITFKINDNSNQPEPRAAEFVLNELQQNIQIEIPPSSGVLGVLSSQGFNEVRNNDVTNFLQISFIEFSINEDNKRRFLFYNVPGEQPRIRLGSRSSITWLKIGTSYVVNVDLYIIKSQLYQNEGLRIYSMGVSILNSIGGAYTTKTFNGQVLKSKEFEDSIDFSFASDSFFDNFKPCSLSAIQDSYNNLNDTFTVLIKIPQERVTGVDGKQIQPLPQDMPTQSSELRITGQIWLDAVAQEIKYPVEIIPIQQIVLS